jgi:hypothetical protein
MTVPSVGPAAGLVVWVSVSLGLAEGEGDSEAVGSPPPSAIVPVPPPELSGNAWLITRTPPTTSATMITNLRVLAATER